MNDEISVVTSGSREGKLLFSYFVVTVIEVVVVVEDSGQPI